MGPGRITEAQFLLTELHYTLGQLHVQLDELDGVTRVTARCGGQTIEEMVSDMSRDEIEFQSQYARLIRVPTPEPEGEDQTALPLAEDAQHPSSLARFERLRSATIALLEGTEERWSVEMLDLVKQHVARDRSRATELAECRRIRFEGAARPDLDEPLTLSRTPHALAGDADEHAEPGDQPAGRPNQR